MTGPKKIRNVERPDRIVSYFKLERWPLALTTVSGVLYNVGMIAGPYFEGRLAQTLLDISEGKRDFPAMVSLAMIYLAVILAVQSMRGVKRFYVRRFANNVSRNMRHMLYNSLVNKDREELEREGLGAVMTKAVADVDACVEGMRKFTTEVFDTGVVLVSYLALLLAYDWRLALLSGAFTPVAYVLAGRLKGRVARYNMAYKHSAGRLNAASMDRISNAVTYRAYGCEQGRDAAFEAHLDDYEKKAVAANLWENSMQPIYHIISMCGVIPVLYLGGKNVLGSGWANWDIAAFTAFLACFARMALKSSRAARLFNAVQKARVSWDRVKPLMREYIEPDTSTTINFSRPVELEISDLSLAWPGGPKILDGIALSARPGQIVGVTGPVACGKSTLGKALIGEAPYTGDIRVGGRALAALSLYERSRLITYMGHEPELMSDSVEENIRLGEAKDAAPYLEAVCLADEVAQMPQRAATPVGGGGVRLSGGQQARLALARTLYNARGILVLDDPFSAVDKSTERAIFDNLRRMAADKIVILISHRLYMFPQLDRVLYLDGGAGVLSTHDELMRDNPAYAELYRAQADGGDAREA
ncbi:MAG: ABC transporter ATP-binding protein [Christensenellaceae bacterium]|nr:ABC transporter ATP-binding protein [Christensenellaceae bacterium]